MAIILLCARNISKRARALSLSPTVASCLDLSFLWTPLCSLAQDRIMCSWLCVSEWPWPHVHVGSLDSDYRISSNKRRPRLYTGGIRRCVRNKCWASNKHRVITGWAWCEANRAMCTLVTRSHLLLQRQHTCHVHCRLRLQDSALRLPQESTRSCIHDAHE